MTLEALGVLCVGKKSIHICAKGSANEAQEELKREGKCGRLEVIKFSASATVEEGEKEASGSSCIFHRVENDTVERFCTSVGEGVKLLEEHSRNLPGDSRVLLVDEDGNQDNQFPVVSTILLSFWIKSRFATLWDAYRIVGGLDKRLRLSISKLDQTLLDSFGAFEKKVTGFSTLSKISGDGEKDLKELSSSMMYNFLAMSQQPKNKLKFGQLMFLDIRPQADFENCHFKNDTSGWAAVNLPVVDKNSIPSIDSVTSSLQDRNLARVWRQWRMRPMMIFSALQSEKDFQLLEVMRGQAENQHKGRGGVFTLHSPFEQFAARFPFLTGKLEKPPARRRLVRRSSALCASWPMELVPGVLYLWTSKMAEKSAHMLSKLGCTHVLISEAFTDFKGFENLKIGATRDPCDQETFEAMGKMERIVVVTKGGQNAKQMETIAVCYMMIQRGCKSVELMKQILEENHVSVDPDWSKIESYFGKGGCTGEPSKPGIIEIEEFVYVAPPELGDDFKALEALNIKRMICLSPTIRKLPAKMEYFSIDFNKVRGGEFSTKFVLAVQFLNPEFLWEHWQQKEREARMHAAESPIAPASENPSQESLNTFHESKDILSDQGESLVLGNSRPKRQPVIVVGTPSKVTCVIAAYLVRTRKLGAYEAFQEVKRKVPWALITKDDCYRLEAFMQYLVQEKEFRSSQTSYIPEQETVSAEKAEEAPRESRDDKASAGKGALEESIQEKTKRKVWRLKSGFRIRGVKKPPQKLQFASESTRIEFLHWKIGCEQKVAKLQIDELKKELEDAKSKTEDDESDFVVQHADNKDVSKIKAEVKSLRSELKGVREQLARSRKDAQGARDGLKAANQRIQQLDRALDQNVTLMKEARAHLEQQMLKEMS
ncbi:hypothetical protein AAMO2058_001304300 [Amorphochlora amoebiformis]